MEERDCVWFLTRAELGDVDVDEPSTNGPVARFNFNLNDLNWQLVPMAPIEAPRASIFPFEFNCSNLDIRIWKF